MWGTQRVLDYCRLPLTSVGWKNKGAGAPSLLTFTDGEVEGKVPEEVKAEELADDAGSGSPSGKDWGSPECCARPGRAQAAQSLPRVPPLPSHPLFLCSSSLQTLCLRAPADHL